MVQDQRGTVAVNGRRFYYRCSTGAIVSGGGKNSNGVGSLFRGGGYSIESRTMKKTPDPLGLAIDLAHDDVERADDGRHVGDQAAAAELVGDREVAERAAAGPDAPGNRRCRR